jgi:hypothetical protein
MNDIAANICQIRVDCREKETASEKNLVGFASQ